MNAASGFGPLLRRLRGRVGVTQERLALDADVSPRHVSFLENGRSAPSREMVLALSNALALPLRDRNALLAAAGFAAVYEARDLEGVELEWVRRAIDHLLAAHEPFGAVAFDRAGDLLRTNDGAQRLLGWAIAGRDVSPAIVGNVWRAVFHPQGLKPVVVDWEKLARAMFARLRHEVAHRPTDALAAVYDEVAAYDGMREIGRHAGTDAGLPFVLIQLRRGPVDLKLFTMITTLGTPLDVTAQEITVESYHPADRATAEALRALASRPEEPLAVSPLA